MRNNKYIYPVVLLAIIFSNNVLAITPKGEAAVAKTEQFFASLQQPACMESSPQVYLKAFKNAERKSWQQIKSLKDDSDRAVAGLIHYDHVLRSLGNYVRSNGLDGTDPLFDELKRSTAGLDIDSPDVELLDTVWVKRLIDDYLDVMHNDMGKSGPFSVFLFERRSSWVLYNIKSDKVRERYIMDTIEEITKEKGFNRNMSAIFSDIKLCVRDKEFLRRASECEKAYTKPK